MFTIFGFVRYKSRIKTFRSSGVSNVCVVAVLVVVEGMSSFVTTFVDKNQFVEYFLSFEGSPVLDANDVVGFAVGTKNGVSISFIVISLLVTFLLSRTRFGLKLLDLADRRGDETFLRFKEVVILFDADDADGVVVETKTGVLTSVILNCFLEVFLLPRTRRGLKLLDRTDRNGDEASFRNKEVMVPLLLRL